MARPEFISYAAPKQVTLEFNRYDPGMFYKNHMDAALMGGVRGQPMRADLPFTVATDRPGNPRALRPPARQPGAPLGGGVAEGRYQIRLFSR